MVTLDIDETIDAFRRGVLDIDCKQMVLTQNKEGGECFEGQGYLRQSNEGILIFKIYVIQHNAEPFCHLDSLLSGGAGQLYSEQMFYELDAIAHDGTHWRSSHILIQPSWSVDFLTVLVSGSMQSITAYLDLPQQKHYLCLHFFEEYNVPLHLMSETVKNGNRHFTLDRTKFDACGFKFEVRKPDGLGQTIVEVTSETPFPVAFNLRVQEALQYITAKTSAWRARIEIEGDQIHLELASPARKSLPTQFSPPISPVSVNFRDYGWKLFEQYLSYVMRETKGTQWNAVAYHLFNACEATANSVDAWSAGVSIAVEAVASLISFEDDEEKIRRLSLFKRRVFEWLADQSDFCDLAKRARGSIDSMSNKRPEDTLYALAATGHVDKSYVKTWRELRNRHVHPTLKDLKKPDLFDHQKLLDRIHGVETLLRQLTFYLIKYEGPFTDYGIHGGQDFPSKVYPLAKT